MKKMKVYRNYDKKVSCGFGEDYRVIFESRWFELKENWIKNWLSDQVIKKFNYKFLDFIEEVYNEEKRYNIRFNFIKLMLVKNRHYDDKYNIIYYLQSEDGERFQIRDIVNIDISKDYVMKYSFDGILSIDQKFLNTITDGEVIFDQNYLDLRFNKKYNNKKDDNNNNDREFKIDFEDEEIPDEYYNEKEDNNKEVDPNKIIVIDNKEYENIFVSKWYDLVEGFDYERVNVSSAIYESNIAREKMRKCLVEWNLKNDNDNLINSQFSHMRVVIVRELKSKEYKLFYEFSTILDRSCTVYCFSIMARKLAWLLPYAFDFVAKYCDGFDPFSIDLKKKNSGINCWTDNSITKDDKCTSDCGKCKHNDCCTCPEYDDDEMCGIDIEADGYEKDVDNEEKESEVSLEEFKNAIREIIEMVNNFIDNY